MMQMNEGTIYHYGDQTLLATFLLGTWVLHRIDDVPMGDVAAYRQMPDGWRECRFAPTATGSELFYGSLVDLESLNLVAVTDATSDIDDKFATLMAELAWEWS